MTSIFRGFCCCVKSEKVDMQNLLYVFIYRDSPATSKYMYDFFLC